MKEREFRSRITKLGFTFEQRRALIAIIKRKFIDADKAFGVLIVVIEIGKPFLELMTWLESQPDPQR